MTRTRQRLTAGSTTRPYVNHTREDVMSFFAGLETFGPGISEAATWRPWHPEPVLRRRDGHVPASARVGAGSSKRSPDRRGTMTPVRRRC